jgi:hypothetical protein
MTRYPANVRAVLEAVRAAGFDPEVANGRHFKVTWFDHGGRRHIIVVSRSPSRARALNNALGDVRRELLR